MITNVRLCQSNTDLGIEYAISLSISKIFYDCVGQHSLAPYNDAGGVCVLTAENISWYDQ